MQNFTKQFSWHKRKLMSLLCLLMTFSLSAQNDLVISGVFDGPLPGGKPKAVELYAINDIADLSQYAVGAVFNGGGSDGIDIQLSGSANAGDYFHISSDAVDASFKAYFGFSSSFSSSSISVNGDDAIELYYDASTSFSGAESVVDVFGDVDVDGTGKPWEYLDGWAYRKDDTGPDGSTFNESNWTFSGKNAVDGCSTDDACASQFPIGTLEISNEVVLDPPATVISEDFSTDPFNRLVGKWSQYSAAGDASSWAYRLDEQAVRMNAYGADACDGDDWLISPPISFSGIGSGTISIDVSSNFSGNGLEVFLADAYVAGTDPNLATKTSYGTLTEADENITFNYEKLEGEQQLLIHYSATSGCAEWFVNAVELKAATLTSTIVQFESAFFLTREGEGTAEVSVQILNPNATNATTVEVEILTGIAGTTGEATDLDNYTTQTLTFPAGSTDKQTLTFTVTDDALMEGTESLVIELKNVTNASIGAISQAVLQIGDNDFTTTAISAIQGAGHTSPMEDTDVQIEGIVTGTDENGFYVQDLAPDTDPKTSEALYVFTSGTDDVEVGDAVTVIGTVQEQEMRADEPTRTQLGNNPFIQVDFKGNDLPEAVILGLGGRLLPTEKIDDSEFDATFEPSVSGIDFYESLENMLVKVQEPMAVTPVGMSDVFVVTDFGANATGLTARNTLSIMPGDLNPEKIEISLGDNALLGGKEEDRPTGAVQGYLPGTLFEDITGIVTYDRGVYEVTPTQDFEVLEAKEEASFSPTVVPFKASEKELLIATYNVLNLDPNNDEEDDDVGEGRFVTIANQIVQNLSSPDILGLQEIQDNTGSEGPDGVVAADVTLQMLVDAITAAGGPAYQYIDNTFLLGEATSGGDPNGNIRTAFLYNPLRVKLVEGSVQTISSQNEGDAFEKARLPLVAQFEFNDTTLMVVNNHFSSKGGSAPIFGVKQPFQDRQEDVSVNGSLDERQVQSEAVQEFVKQYLKENDNAPVVVLGDLNEFAYVSPVADFDEFLYNLTNKVPLDDRYTFIFQGNSQVLDHILVSDNLAVNAKVQIAHLNVDTEETDASGSDHEPVVALLDFADLRPLPRASGQETLVFRISSEDDDAEEQLENAVGPFNTTKGNVDSESSDIELGYQENFSPQLSALRFDGISIPKGAVIKEAYLQFTVDESDDDYDGVVDSELYIIAEKSADPETYVGDPTTSDASFGLTNREYLKDSVEWMIPDGTWDVVGESGPDQRSTNIASLVQQLVNMPNWEAGNAMAFAIGGTGLKVAEGYDPNNPEAGARLIVNYVPATNNEYFILSSTDDAEQYLPGGTRPENEMDLPSSDIELGSESDETDQLSGLRFAELDIPQGAIISSATIQFVVDNFNKNLDPAEFYIVVEDSDSTHTYTETVGDITSRSYYSDGIDSKGRKSMDSVYWSVQAGTWTNIGDRGPAEMTANIATLLQYIVNKDDWKEGNAVSFVIGGTGRREAGSFDSGTPASLIVDFVPFKENSTAIGASTDDAEEYLPGGARPNNGMDIGSSDLELGQETGPDNPTFDETFQLTGLRFNELQLPKGAIIESASIEFTVDATNKNIDPTELYIIVEDSSTPSTYVDVDGNISSRSYFNDGINSQKEGMMPADTVFWNIEAGTWDVVGDKYSTPNIAKLLEAVVSRSDWEAGGSVAFVIGGTGIREAESFDGDVDSAPVLNFKFAQGGRPAAKPQIIQEIADIETTQGAFFSVDFNQYFEDKDTPLSYEVFDLFGREIDGIALSKNGVLRGSFDKAMYQAVMVEATSFGDTVNQFFNIIAKPKMKSVLTQLSSVQIGTAFDKGAAEISAFDATTDKLYVTNSETDVIEVINMADPTSPSRGTPIDISSLGGGVNSVAVANGMLAVAIEADVKQDPGFVYIYSTTDESELASYTVGALPDMVTFNEDGTVIIVANEGEPNDDYTVDPEGTVSIINLPLDLSTASPTDVETADFKSYNTFSVDELRESGILISGPGATVAQDLEPEYVTVLGDSAFVTLQENNAVALVRISTATVEDIFGLGFKDHSLSGNGIDPSKDDDLPLYIDNGLPFQGVYMPDAIASMQIGDKKYLFTANEGDAREYGDYTDETEIGKIDFDSNFFPDAEEIEIAADGLGIMNISQQSGDGKYQELLTYGARSFSIWEVEEGQIYDSGDDFEQITATIYPENFNASDDKVKLRNRSDNKGPEPEAITLGKVGETSFAFVALERIGGIMVYDVTDPNAPEFVEYLNNRDFTKDPKDDFLTAGDNAPEGLVFVPAADSPSGQALLIVSNEVSGTVTTYQVGDVPVVDNTFTLELLHVTDQEAGAPAIQDAPRLSAVMNALEAQDLGGDGIADNTVRLSSGDAFIPGLFYDASGDAFGFKGVADIQIQNELGFQAISLGNHEFDFGTEVLSGLISGDTPTKASFDLTGTDLEGDVTFQGTDFPYLSSNLDFSKDEDMSALVVESAQGPVGSKITSSTILDVNGESIGVVGATTPTLASISSPGGVVAMPAPFANDPSDAEIDALAKIIQDEVDHLLDINPTMNKVIVLAHMQRIDIEFALAEKLKDVDIIVAGGSNTRLTDSNDRLRDGDTKQGDYPAFFTNAGGTSTAVVNTDGSYKYVGRLVIDFDEDGDIVPASYDADVSGVYATDEQGVTDLSAAAHVDPEVQAIADAIEDAIVAKESNVFGIADVYLNGNRSGSGASDDPDGVRTQETNFGNLTADANLAAAKTTDPTVRVSIKNGGGIRSSIGQIIVPAGGTEAVRLPNESVKGSDGSVVKPEGGISENDINTSLAFNNGLSLLTLTHQQLVEVLEHGVGALPTVAGQFIQIAGVKLSFDPTSETGSRVQNAIFVDENGKETARLVNDGTVVLPEQTVRVVTLNFLAGGGDNYPFPQEASANRVNLYDLDGDGKNDGATGDATFADDGTEQDALAEYLLDNYNVDAYNIADVGPNSDERIQNLAFRADGLEPISVELSSSTVEVTEGDEVTITVTATKAVVGDQVFEVTISGANTDVELASTTITILDGEVAGTVKLTIKDDSEVEDIETVTVTLSNPSLGTVLGAVTSVEIEITDNDTVSGIGEDNSGFTLFPNPTNTNMELVASERIVSVLVCNVFGTVIDELEVDSSSIVIPMKDKPTGNYLVKVLTQSGKQKVLQAVKF
ncbi:choice-of-anchor I family protein [Reichenbachiella versicolor]|uniref:choice-of-anchor I family protein n=1 Tax=Reichenbachiella versicolor TaxID=1821036 RepID=UPI000D6E5035|nr:choice-of-anchor I family protein [Reichenbachiella versicolor]